MITAVHKFIITSYPVYPQITTADRGPTPLKWSEYSLVLRFYSEALLPNAQSLTGFQTVNNAVFLPPC